jgi:hypothetical protein
LRILDDLFINLRRDVLDDHFRQQHPRARALAHQRHRLLHQRREGAQAGDPVFIILDRLKAQQFGQLIGGLNAATLVERHEIHAILVLRDINLIFLLKQVVVHLILRRELRAINRLEPIEHLDAVLLSPLDRPETDVFPAVIVAPITERRRKRRVLAQHVFPLVGEQIMKSLRRVVHRRTRSHRPLLCGSGYVRQADRQQHEKEGCN